VAAVRARLQFAHAPARPLGLAGAVRSRRCREPRTILNAVDMLDALIEQAITLAMKTAIIFFGDSWHAHNAPRLWLAAHIR
jgi:hypothetical protein